MSEQDNQTQASIPQDDAATTPIDLASAFKILNQANREAAQESVDPGQDDNGNLEMGSGEHDGGEPDESGSDESTGSIDAGSESDDGGSYVGGSSDGIQAIDFNAYKQQMLKDIQNDALSQTRKLFNEENIGYYSISELQVKDEQTGKVHYRNPDVQDERDPDYYFRSRTDAQNFCDSWNKGVDFEFRKAVNEKQQELLGQAAPTARLIDFLPKWQAMDNSARAIFDALLEGHEVRDSRGKEIGFNVDLNAVAAQAEKIAKQFNSAPAQSEQQQQQQQAKQADGPALDMKTGNGVSSDDVEPKNIGEALKMFDKKNRGK